MTDKDAKILQGQQIKELFDLCTGLSESLQIDTINNSDFSEGVKTQVKKLLQYSQKDLELTETIIDSVQVSLDIKTIQPGMKIGSYLLQKQIGHGGQGEVWLAFRKDGDFEHQVAIKFLKPVHDGHELIRFQNERKLLAGLKHPNIAQLLDGGELADNRPYMILELIEGLPLLEYCKKHDYNLKQYLNIFLQICDAISYAHSHLVVHRDIKPNNIFVTNNGVVKLLDFGIAKLVEDKAMDTQTIPIMTLAYSSPEQVNGAPISTATDIYILGLLLYEMLTGQRAQAIHSDAPTELIHEITEKIPTSPSEVELLSSLKRNYNSKQLKGDLDNLIMMAIRKEPNRRYPSVLDLANDVKNYLAGRPLAATGDSHWYKLKKLVTRNPAITALTATVLCFLVILPMVLYNSQQQISQQRDLEVEARKEAQQQSILADRTKDFLINILKSASPLANKGKDISLKDVLTSSERQLEKGLTGQPILKAELINTLSSIYHHLGDSKKAIAFYQKSLPIYEQNHDISGQVFTLGQMAVISIIDNDPLGAEKYAKDADKLSKQLTDPIEIAWHNSRMATWQGKMGQKQKAQKTLLQTLAMLKQNQVEDHELLGRIYNELAITANDNQQSLKYIDKALHHAEKDHGKIHPKYFNRLINKAARLNQNNQTKAAESTFLLAQEIGNQLYDKKHPRMGLLYGELAFIYQDTGRFNIAKKYFEEALFIDKKYSGIESLSYVLRTNNLGFLYEDMGMYNQAEQLYRESLALREQYFSADPMRVAGTQFNLARLLAKTARYDESEQLLNKVIPVYQAKKRNILSAEIVQLANQLGSDPSISVCQTANIEIIRLKTDVEKISEKSWLRMYHELWLGEFSQKCGLNHLAITLLTAAKKHSQSIYADNSVGQLRIIQKVDSLLKQMT